MCPSVIRQRRHILDEKLRQLVDQSVNGDKSSVFFRDQSGSRRRLQKTNVIVIIVVVNSFEPEADQLFV